MSTVQEIAAWKAYAKGRCKTLLIPFENLYEKQIQQESGWDHYDSQGNVKTSPSGAKGLGQLSSTLYSETQWKDPYTNLDTSLNLMDFYHRNYGSWKKALAAYNWGPANVSGYKNAEGIHPAWDGTREWVCPVQGRYCGTTQMHHYLDVILGPEWKEPSEVSPIVTAPADVFSVGTGVRERMAELKDKPATNEVYLTSGYSVTYGESGREYVYIKSTNRTHVFEPRNLAVVEAIPPVGPTNLPMPWNSVWLITAGFSTPAEWKAEFGVDRNIQAVVFHDMEGYLEGAIATWNQGGAGAHLCVLRDGSIVQTVRLEDVAWHAGTDNTPGSGTYGRTPFWRTHNINPYSVGVELEGFVTSGYTPAQLAACVKIGVYLSKMYKIPVVHIADSIPGYHTHSEISSQRSDPGPLFPFDSILAQIKEQTT